MRFFCVVRLTILNNFLGMMKKNAKQVKISKKNSSRQRAEAVRNRKSPTSSQDEDDDSEDDNLPSSYHQISIQVI